MVCVPCFAFDRVVYSSGAHGAACTGHGNLPNRCLPQLEHLGKRLHRSNLITRLWTLVLHRNGKAEVRETLSDLR